MSDIIQELSDFAVKWASSHENAISPLTAYGVVNKDTRTLALYRDSSASTNETPWILLFKNGTTWFARGYVGVFNSIEESDLIVPTVSLGEEPKPIFSEFWSIFIPLQQHVFTLPVLRKVKDVTFTQVGGMFPFQAEGTLAGHPFYFRYRSGSVSLRVGGEDVVGEPLYISGMNYGGEYGGDLSREQFAEVFPQMVASLERQLPLWQFQGTYVSGSMAGRTSHAAYHADTPEEAWKAIHTVPEGWAYGAEQWEKSVREMGLNPVPLSTEDKRTFPAKDPDFASLVS